MDSFTNVDLSKIPVPDIVEQFDFETLLAMYVREFTALDPAYAELTESDPVMVALQVFAYREMMMRQRANEACKAVMISLATGGDLDHMGALLGVKRFMLHPGDAAAGTAPVYESDSEFRSRIHLAPESFSVAGPEGAYIAHTLSAHEQILDASAISPAPGDIVVTVLSRNSNGVASAEILAAVEAKLTHDDVRPMSDRVTVQTAEIVNYQVNATLYTFAGPDTALVVEHAVSRLNEFVAASHRLGRDIPLSGIYSALHVEGVQRVELASPDTDLVISRTQAAYCTSMSVASGGFDE